MKGLPIFWTRMTVELLPMSLYTHTPSAADSLRPRDGTQCFYSLEVVDRVSETQLQMCENYN